MSDESTSDLIEVGVRDLIAYVEGKVSGACIGPPRAFFEIPVGSKGLIRGIYRVYVFHAPTIREALVGIKACIKDQIKRAESISSTTFLFWRLAEKIEVEVADEGNGYYARTRFTVLPEGEEDES